MSRKFIRRLNPALEDLEGRHLQSGLVASPQVAATPLLHALVTDPTAPDEETAAIAARGTLLKTV